MSTIKADNIATLAGVSTSMANAVNGSAKAWVNFNGTGTVAIRASHNASSITDIGSADYIINFATAMPDINYAAVGNFGTLDQNWNSAQTSPMVVGGTYSGAAFTPYYSTTQLGVCNYGAGDRIDIELANVVVFR